MNPVLLLILPVVFQLIAAKNSVTKKIRLTFFKVSLISFLSQLLVSYFAFKIFSENLRIASGGQIRCGMPLLGILTLELLLILVLLIIILTQYLIKRSKNKRDATQ